MANLTLAIPSKNPGGLDAEIDAHFGHCDLYTLVELDDGKITKVKELPAVAHHQGGCMAPVQYLADNGVKVLISGGMGLRPLMGFKQVNIDVYHGGNNLSVKSAVEAFSSGDLAAFSTEMTCGGGR